ncbi:MAG: DUF3822 family protein [Saprospiraceae bacterium]
MGVIRYDITEDAFDLQRTSSFELSILTGVDSSSYLITDENRAVVCTRTLAHSPFEEWWKDEQRIQLHFQKTRLAWTGSTFTLVPARLYNGENRKSLLSALATPPATATILADPIPELDAVVVYAIEQDQLTQWRRVFDGCRIYHAVTPLLHLMRQQTVKAGRPLVFAFLFDKNMTTVALSADRLLFCNSFVCKDTKDYLYYLLLTYEQAGLSPEKIRFAWLEKS